MKKMSRAVMNGVVGLPAPNQCAVCFRVRPLCAHGICRSRFCNWIHNLPAVAGNREGRA